MITTSEFLKKNNIEHYTNFDVSTISSIKIGTKCKLVIFPRNTSEFSKLLIFLYTSKIFYRVFGNASNVLFVKELNYPIIFTMKMRDEITIDGGFVTSSSGVLISKFSDTLRKNKLSGFEGLVNIPGTIGGATMTNAGAFGYSISDNIVKIKVFYEGKIFEISKSEIKFGYHFTNLSGFIILTVTFWFENKNEYDIISLSNKFTYMRNKTQPGGLSLGSVYRRINSKSAGFYIERAGLKGTRVGGVVVSSKHSNFFINEGNGSALDFLNLCLIVENAVEKQFGVCLVSEIEKIGDKDEIDFRLSYPFKV